MVVGHRRSLPPPIVNDRSVVDARQKRFRRDDDIAAWEYSPPKTHWFND
jgi:hypothetical protein